MRAIAKNETNIYTSFLRGKELETNNRGDRKKYVEYGKIKYVLTSACSRTTQIATRFVWPLMRSVRQCAIFKSERRTIRI